MPKTALRFARQNPHIVKATRDFISEFTSIVDPVVKVASLAESEDAQMAWVLLGSVISQDLSYLELESILLALFKAFPNKSLWETPVPKASDLTEVIQKALGKESWSLLEQAPGMFWSVGFFVRKHLPLKSWLESRTEEELWRDLGEIYFMGKKRVRPKASSAIYRLKSPPPLGLGLPVKEGDCFLRLPLSMGARRFMAFIGPGKEGEFSSWTPEKKQTQTNEWFKILSPSMPIQSAHALTFFLEPGQSEYLCREHFRLCKNCPLFSYCSYGKT